MGKKILVIGNGAKEYALAKYLSRDNIVYVAPSSDTIKEFAECIDIRENSVAEILEFVMENEIDITIPVSDVAMKSDIVKNFLKNNLQIFAPERNAYKIIEDKAFAKKILYKLRIPTPKFGIFEKQAMATDYIKNINEPYVIKTNEPSSAVVFAPCSSSKILVDYMFSKPQQKIVIEDYVYGTPFLFYAITDGYKALKFGSSILYKHSLEGDGGQLTSGMGACSPNYKLTLNNEEYLMKQVIYPTLEYLAQEENPYVGILGVNGILTEDNKIQILGYQSFMQEADCQAVLECLNADLCNLMQSCIIGSFSDETESIEFDEQSAVSLVVQCRNKNNKENVISGIENLSEDILINYYPIVRKNKYYEYEAENGSVMILTAKSTTISSAVKKIYSEASELDFNGIYYRKDICKPLLADI